MAPAQAPADSARSAGRSLLALVCGLAATLLLGCQHDEIHKYKVPKEEEPPQQAKAEGGRPAIRMLVAIFPQPDRTWFFKLMGLAQAVEEHKEEFDRFIQSVRFTPQGEKPVTWTAPESWQHEPGGSEFRYATFLVGTKDAPAQLLVTPLEGKAGSVLANVNRWRGQIGLGEISQAELGKLSREIKVNGVAVTVVDMVNPGAAAKARSPLPLKYTVPEGWKELPSAKSPAVAALRVSEGGQSAETTVTPFAGEGGGLVPNVNRWRGQIGLGPAGEVEIRKEAHPIAVHGVPALYVDLTGPESAGGKRLLGVITAESKGQTWFFKMTGPAELVGKQKPAFEAFIDSVRFDGGTGANHE